MRNLLTAPLPENEIAAILAATAGRPSLPLLGDPVWSAVRDNPAITAWLLPLIARADAEASEPLPILTDELYADFAKTGDRLPFERPYFERRRRLGRAAMAVLLGDDATRTRLLPSFIKKLGEIMDEESWTLPAHVWNEPTGKNPWMIDLFAAETANNFADLLVVFAAVIPADLTQRIKTRLHVQIFENYVNPRTTFHWLTITNNWNAVCHQGVLGAALAVEEDHALVARMLSVAATRLPAFLTGYGADGSTSEGPGYWSYGFGWFAELNAQLEHRTRGQLSLFEGDEKVAAIARFAPQVTLAEGHFVNFSDGGRTGRLSSSLLTYLGQRLADTTLTAQGTAIYRHQADTGLDLDILRTDFFYLSRLALRVASTDVLATAREPVHPDVFFDDYGAIVTRGTDAGGHLWEFAAKGGHNAEHHNHNDCGSFLLNVDGAPAIIEIGAPEYVRAFFSDKRYDFLAARSLGHSVPFVNGCEQPEGAAFAATILKTEIGGDRVEFSVDLTKCYPPEARCVSLIRSWVFQKSAGRITISDTYELAAPGVIESLLICPPAVTRDGADALITTPKAVLRITPATGSTLTAVETCDYRGHHGTDEKVSRIRFAPNAPSRSGVIAYEVSLR
ncbi:heparinase II/III domain-containing protein [Rariglobus hedericola]|uniref:Heparinase n=1 Tax=Rariglobus hedericola TaxID=2597822 RepID=A0A556QSG6_9BACT|nr:heparinase II/III family protein [Rariglobus hedericola]TSJ79580.1 heparinase [Rariglobus hedericola]